MGESLSVGILQPLKVQDMAMAGIFVNILSALLIGFGIYYYMPLIFQK